MKTDPKYLALEIHATLPSDEIWLGDDSGYLVAKSTGILQEGLLAGDYVVEFGLGSTVYPIQLHDDKRLTQVELEAGPTCARPDVKP